MALLKYFRLKIWFFAILILFCIGAALWLPEYNARSLSSRPAEHLPLTENLISPVRPTPLPADVFLPDRQKPEQVQQENSQPEPLKAGSFPWHTNITATVFWVGEPQGGGSSEDNALSAWDDEWQKSFGCFDDPVNRNGFFPAGCIPKENPFYLDLPYNDFDFDQKTGQAFRKQNAGQVVPWAKTKVWPANESMMKNQWVELFNPATQKTCFGQIQDAGPYEYDDWSYVFGVDDQRPKNKLANNAGMDVSPALRDCLGFVGLDNDENTLNWRFVERSQVSAGAWLEIVTRSQINWR